MRITSRWSIHVVISLAFVLLSCVPAHAARGKVTHRVSGCDYFTVETSRGFAILEWYGGHDPDKGDSIVGNYESYGMKTVFDETTEQEVRVWVEDYALSKSDALEKLYDKCE